MPPEGIPNRIGVGGGEVFPKRSVSLHRPNIIIARFPWYNTVRMALRLLRPVAISLTVLVLISAVGGVALLLLRSGSPVVESTTSYAEELETTAENDSPFSRPRPSDGADQKEESESAESPSPSLSEVPAGPVTDDLMLHALERWRPADQELLSPRFSDRPIRILDRTGTDDVNPAGRSDRFLLDLLGGAESEQLQDAILERSRDPVLRRLVALRELPADPIGVYAFLDTTVAGVREYLILLPEDPLLVTIYETTDGIEDIEIRPFDQRAQQ